MRIAYVYPVPVPSQLAAPIQILSTCRALADLGAEVTVHLGALRAADAEAVLRFYGLTPHPRLALSFDPGARPVPEALRARGDADGALDVVMSRGEPGIALFGRLGRARGARRHVYEAHRLSYAEAGRWEGEPALSAPRRALRAVRTYLAERRAVRRADGIVALTPGVESALRGAFAPRAPMLVLPSGTAPPPPRVPPVAERDIDVLYAGKLARRKGVPDLIAAMAHLPGRQLWLLGGGDAERELARAQAEQHDVSARVHLPGFVPPEAVRAWFVRARVGVCPLPAGESRIAESYTSPLKVMEMMACGTPIVGTRVPSLASMLTDGRDATLVEPGAPEALARGIGALLADPARAQLQADAARARAAGAAWPARARRLHDFLSALDRGPAAHGQGRLVPTDADSTGRGTRGP